MALFSRRREEYFSYTEKKRFKYKLFFLIKLIVLLLVFYHLITVVLLSSFTVNNVSMEPLFKLGDRVLTSPLVYGATLPFIKSRLPGLSSPQRGDVVIAMPGNYSKPSLLLRIADPFVRFFTLQSKTVLPRISTGGTVPYIVKRVVGIPGDTLKIEDYTAYIKPADSQYFLSESEIIDKEYNIKKEPLPEEWETQFPSSSHYSEITLEEGEYFVLGDNRSTSEDSRHFGPLRVQDIISKVIFCYWPLKHIDVP